MPPSSHYKLASREYSSGVRSVREFEHPVLWNVFTCAK